MPPMREGNHAADSSLPSPRETPAGRWPHILVAEDEEDLGETLRRALRREGYHITLACNGLEALCALREQPCDLLITDLRMPRLGGMDLLREAKQLHPALPVILITGFGDRASYLEGMSLGAVHFLCKPLKIAELVAVVRQSVKPEGFSGNSSESA